MRTPNATIKVDADCGDLVETRIIDGRKYILVRVEGDVELEGLNVRFDAEQPPSAGLQHPAKSGFR